MIKFSRPVFLILVVLTCLFSPFCAVLSALSCNCSSVLLSPAINLSAVSTTPANNPCHGFSVMACGADTGNKFLTGDNNTGDKFSPMTTTPVNNYCR
jgi:hypothetical protein